MFLISFSTSICFRDGYRLGNNKLVKRDRGPAWELVRVGDRLRQLIRTLRAN
jgi:hypothetical protein